LPAEALAAASHNKAQIAATLKNAFVVCICFLRMVTASSNSTKGELPRAGAVSSEKGGGGCPLKTRKAAKKVSLESDMELNLKRKMDMGIEAESWGDSSSGGGGLRALAEVGTVTH
jgi:hypothetical protein